MLSSAGGGHQQWDQLRGRLNTTALSYGRPGLAGSDPLSAEEASEAQALSAIAGHLHELLAATSLAPPYVLTGCSIGGWIADRFAALWPEEVAGLVQIDPTMINPIPKMETLELIDDADGRGYLLNSQEVRTELLANPPTSLPRTVVLSRALGSIPAQSIAQYWKPLTPAEADDGWRVCQREWAHRLGATHLAAHTAGHHIQIDQPDLVAFVLRAVVEAARQNIDLTLDEDQVEQAGGEVPNTRTTEPN
jgi:pimeloyl-ACP methyl ester carboxylesterase